jgi:hypothetical protein
MRHEAREAVKAKRASFLARDANNIFEPRTFTCLADVSQLRSRFRELQEPREQTPTPTSQTSSFHSIPETFDSNENTPQSGNSLSLSLSRTRVKASLGEKIARVLFAVDILLELYVKKR